MKPTNLLQEAPSMAPKSGYGSAPLAGRQMARRMALGIALEQIVGGLAGVAGDGQVDELVDELAACVSLVQRAATRSQLANLISHVGSVAWQLDAAASGGRTRAVMEAADAVRQALQDLQA